MKEFKYTIIWHAKGYLTDFNLKTIYLFLKSMGKFIIVVLDDSQPKSY